MSYFLVSGNGASNFTISFQGVDISDFITSWQMSTETETYDVSTFGSATTQTISGQTWNTATVTVTWPAEYESEYWAHEVGA